VLAGLFGYGGVLIGKFKTKGFPDLDLEKSGYSPIMLIQAMSSKINYIFT